MIKSLDDTTFKVGDRVFYESPQDTGTIREIKLYQVCEGSDETILYAVKWDDGSSDGDDGFTVGSLSPVE